MLPTSSTGPPAPQRPSPDANTSMSASSHPTRKKAGRGRGSGRGRARGGPPRGRGGRPPRRANVHGRRQDAGGEAHSHNPNEPSVSSVSGHGSRGGRRRFPKPSANESKPAFAQQKDSPAGHNTPTSAINNQLVDMTELSARLSALMTRGAVECVICLDRIRRQAPLWNCQTCYTITHLHCARKWAGHSADGDSTTSNAPTNSSLACPKCRAPIDRASLFNFCYCRRRKAPPTEPGVVPGSCGEPCRKPRSVPESSCVHKCNLLCHPGPCPPCLVLRPPQPCFCGKRTIVRTCGEPDGTTSCQNPCGKVRSCGHPCDRVCHPGECSECPVVVAVHCFCGRNETLLPCGVKGYACESICNKPLSCGTHQCTASCHEGPCAPCKWSPNTWSTCACGKQPLSASDQQKRTACTDPIPSCGQVCAQPLGCIGSHTCEKMCGHPRECGKCDKTVQAECRCGATVEKVRCGDDPATLRSKLLCDKKCNDRLLCRQHNCQIICCPFRRRKVARHGDIAASDHLWPMVGIENGLTVVERRRAGHKCSEVCKKQLSCGKHNCDLTCGHMGPCPPCGFLIREPVTCACGAESIPPPVRCGTPAPSCRKKCSVEKACGHPCPDYCHFGPCPPCLEIVKRSCVGDHGESRFVHCHIGAKGIRCHRACGRPLKCGIHACLNPCHGNYPEDCENSTPEGCNQICALPRKKCEHSCASKCHPEIMCPDVPCKVLVSVTCPCGRRKEQAMCLRGGQSHGTESENRIRLTCDEECAAQSRLRGFAAAVGKELLSDGTVIESKPDDPESCDIHYSDFLLRFAEHEPSILARFERDLASIVLSRTRKVVMEDMPELHRCVLHTLTDLYLLDSESSGRGKSRRITIRHRGAGVKPVFPKPLLSEALVRREHEKRRNRMENRNLAIHVSPGYVTSGRSSMETRVVEQNLKEHAGFYRIVGKTIMSGGALEGILVKFSTMERASVVLASLKSRPGVTVEVVKQTRTSGDVSNEEVPRQDQAVGTTEAASRPWNDEDDHPNWNSGSIFALSRPAATHIDDADVPDSWDD